MDYLTRLKTLFEKVIQDDTFYQGLTPREKHRVRTYRYHLRVNTPISEKLMRETVEKHMGEVVTINTPNKYVND